MAINFEEKHDCRLCKASLSEPILDIGNLYPSNFVEDTVLETDKVPLALVECTKCGLVQLAHTVNRDEMYRHYWYRSGLNNSMVEDLKDIAIQAVRYLTPDSLEVVVDIGCNDGTYLKFFEGSSYIRVGFDPAQNLADLAKSNCDYFVNDYFTKENFDKLELDKAKIITAVAMLYDLDDISSFMEDIVDILADDGVFIVQFTDFTTTLKINAIDNVCHEHLEYYTLRDLNNIAERFGLEIINVSHNNVNGGSIRVYMGKNGQHQVSATVDFEIKREAAYLEHDNLTKLAGRIEYFKERTKTFIEILNRYGSTVAVMGASTKGNTLLQYYDIDNSLIDHAAEINPEKYGLNTVGTNIPIVSQTESLERNPEVYFVLPWHFINNFVENNKEYLKSGGAFFVPLPVPAIYTMNEEGEVEHERLI